MCTDLIPVKKPATFHISVSGGGAAELAVSVRGPHGELPVRIKGDVQSGFNAEFTPTTVGAHTINVEYNGYAVQVSQIIRIHRKKKLPFAFDSSFVVQHDII